MSRMSYDLGSQLNGVFRSKAALETGGSYRDRTRRHCHNSASPNGDARMYPFRCSTSTSPDDELSERAAELYSLQADMPIKVLNGAPGYINILDGLNAWQLVSELTEAAGGGIPAAASFKQVSPAGAALGIPLNEAELLSYIMNDLPISSKRPSLAAAVARARGADRMSSLGDFIALSHRCDELTAKIISRELSDGVIAPDYDDVALSILAKKKNGNYIILKIDPKFLPVDDEVRTIFGLKLKQKRNNPTISADIFEKGNIEVPKNVIDDLLVASITTKYTQSNAVCFACRGQVIGLGAGLHSKLNCARLAGEKSASWWLRQNDRILNLPWKLNVRRIEKMTIIDTIIGIHAVESLAPTNNAATTSHHHWNNYFTEPILPFTQKERKEWLEKMAGVCVASDSFFTSPESIESVKQFGAKYIVCVGVTQPNEEVVKACEDNGIVLIHSVYDQPSNSSEMPSSSRSSEQRRHS